MSNKLSVVKEDVVDVVTEKIRKFSENDTLRLPPNYSVENALKSAWLILQETTGKDKQPALECCTKNSIANALLDMAVQGLSPSKKQCYFIVRGDKLCLDPSYFGAMAVTKRLNDVEDITANVIYEGDEFDYEINIETAKKRILKHKQDFMNIDHNKIKGAYCLIKTAEGKDDYLEIMNMTQIKNSWNMGYGYGKSKAHKDFTDQMAKKTVINRAAKYYMNTSDDSDLMVGAYNRSLESSSVEDPQKMIEAEANTGEEISFDDQPDVVIVEDKKAGGLSEEEKAEALEAEKKAAQMEIEELEV